MRYESIQKRTAIIIVGFLSLLLISGYVLFVKSVGFIKAMAYESKSLKISEINTCNPAQNELETPHFSGCSSIL